MALELQQDGRALQAEVQIGALHDAHVRRCGTSLDDGDDEDERRGKAQAETVSTYMAQLRRRAGEQVVRRVANKDEQQAWQHSTAQQHRTRQDGTARCRFCV